MKARRSVSLGWCPSDFQWGLFGLFPFRLEEITANWNSTRPENSSVTNPLLTCKEVADEHNNGLASRYVPDPDTSLFRVSMSPASPARLIHLIYVFFPC